MIYLFVIFLYLFIETREYITDVPPVPGVKRSRKIVTGEAWQYCCTPAASTKPEGHK